MVCASKGCEPFFISCLIFFATTEHSSDLCLLKQSTGRFKATFCAQQTAQLGDRDSENAKPCTFRGIISFPDIVMEATIVSVSVEEKAWCHSGVSNNFFKKL